MGAKRRGLLVAILAVAMLVSPVVSVRADSGVRSASVGDDIFLEGQYISVGVSGSGSFGTASPAPAGFHPTPFHGGEIGLSADPDGFDTGNAPVNGDFFLPGDPEERFNVGYKLGEQPYVYTNAEQEGEIDIPRESSANLSHDDVLSARWVGLVPAAGEGAGNALRVTQTVEFKGSQSFFKTTVVLDNIGSVPLQSVRYMRNVDPDQDADLHGEFTTVNTVVAQQPGDKKALVRADGLSTHTPIFYYSADSGARVSTFGFSNEDPYDPMAYEEAGVYEYDTYVSALGSATEDQAISICADLGTLMPGDHAAFVYYTSLDADFESALEQIQEDQQTVRDTAPPIISLPDYGLSSRQVFSAPPTVAVGATMVSLLTDISDDSGVAHVTLLCNGSAIPAGVQNGRHAYPLLLQEGNNSVQISAQDDSGNRAVLSLVLSVDSTGPALSVDSMPASTTAAHVIIKGIVADPSGVRTLAIDGLSVRPDAAGEFEQDLPLIVGANQISIEASDNHGNTTRRTLSVTRLASPSPASQRSLDITVTVGQQSMQVNGMPVAMDAAPVIQNGRTLLPIRALIQTLGGTTSWNAATRTATVTLGGRTVVLTIGSKTALVNGKPTTLDVAPAIISGRTFLPLRFVGENLGLDLAWDAPSQTISFTYWP